MFVYDPNNPDSEDDLNRFVEMFPKKLKLKTGLCVAFINNHNPEGNPQYAMPQSMAKLDKFEGSVDSTQGVQQIALTFEKYLVKLLK